jgi:hypothetical protein
MRRVARFVVRPLVVGPLVMLLVAVGIGAFAMRGGTQPRLERRLPALAYDPRVGEPDLVHPLFESPTPTPSPTAMPSHSPAPKPKPTPTPTKRAAGPSLTAFRGLGAWVDLYDYEFVEAEPAVADMAAHGVKTLYLQTGRWNKPAPDNASNFQNYGAVERWLTSAHAHGLKVIGWYLPAYDDMTRDVRRTRAIAQFRSHSGQKFDGLGIDVEYKGQMPSLAAWNRAVATHAKKVRTALGSRYAIAAIVPAPLAMEVRPESWVGFPWRSLADVSNVFMPMAYWSFRHDCAEKPEHCAYGYTKGNVERVRALTGKPRVPVHVIGGVGDEISTDDVSEFVRAANAVDVYGGSLYDYQTTKAEYWPLLGKLD